MLVSKASTGRVASRTSSCCYLATTITIQPADNYTTMTVFMTFDVLYLAWHPWAVEKNSNPAQRSKPL